MLNLDLDGRRVLVTGASSGIGREVSIVLSQLGASIVLCGRDENRLQETRDAMSKGDHLLAPFDLSEGIEAIPGWIQGLVSTGRPFNGVVHCAGIEATRPVRQMDTSLFDSVVRINTTVALMLAKGIFKKNCYMLPCSVVFVSSVASLKGIPGKAAYCASKGALNSMTKSLSAEVARKGIRVNTVCPGYVETKMSESLQYSIPENRFQEILHNHPLGIGKPEDVAAAVAFLISDMSRWITGSNLVIDGGYTAI